MDVIEEALNSVETCDNCQWVATFEERKFPMMFHTCKICGRNLCPKCWGHKHLFAWRYCKDCRPDEYWEVQDG